MWQDMVIMAGNVAMDLAFVKTILAPYDKPPRLTCVVFVASLVGYAVALGSMGLWLSTGAMVVGAIEWTIVLLQKRGRETKA